MSYISFTSAMPGPWTKSKPSTSSDSCLKATIATCNCFESHAFDHQIWFVFRMISRIWIFSKLWMWFLVYWYRVGCWVIRLLTPCQVLDTCTVRMWSTEISSTLEALKPEKPWGWRFWSLRALQQKDWYVLQSNNKSDSQFILIMIIIEIHHYSRSHDASSLVIIYHHGSCYHGSWIVLDHTKAWEHPHLI